MTLHITSCKRADFNATEARDLARAFERDVEVNYCPKDDCEWRNSFSTREQATIVAALRAFA